MAIGGTAMSTQDQPPGVGYWKASDGNWYPPHQHPDPAYRQQYAAPAQRPPLPPPQQPAGTAREARADAKAAKARAKAMRPWFKKKRFMIPLVLVVIGVIVAVAGGGDDDDGDGTAGDADEFGELLSVGQTDTTSGFEITLLTVETPFQVGEFEPGPDPGNRLIGVELSARNTTDEAQTMSSLLGLEVQDSSGQRFPITLAGMDRPQFGGTVEPGALLRGWAVFEVPEASTGLQLLIKGSVTASGVRYDLGVG